MVFKIIKNLFKFTIVTTSTIWSAQEMLVFSLVKKVYKSIWKNIKIKVFLHYTLMQKMLTYFIKCYKFIMRHFEHTKKQNILMFGKKYLHVFKKVKASKM